jgi:hypothetical protein
LRTSFDPMAKPRPSRYVTAAAAVLLCVAVPANTAAAAPVDKASAHAAVAALVSWQTGLMADAPISRQGDEQFVASVAAGCPDVLAAVNLLPSSGVNRAAPFALGEEIAADLFLARFLPAERSVTASFASTVERLPWSSSVTRAEIRREMQAQRRYFALAPSNLCADARALAASNTRTTPAATLRFLAAFGRDFAGVQASPLNAAINRYKTPPDASLIRAANRNGPLLVAARKALVISEAPKVLSILGLSSSAAPQTAQTPGGS